MVDPQTLEVCWIAFYNTVHHRDCGQFKQSIYCTVGTKTPNKVAISHYGKSIAFLVGLKATKVANLAREFEVPRTTLILILKNKAKNYSDFEAGRSRETKQKRKHNFDTVEQGSANSGLTAPWCFNCILPNWLVAVFAEIIALKAWVKKLKILYGPGPRVLFKMPLCFRDYRIEAIPFLFKMFTAFYHDHFVLCAKQRRLCLQVELALPAVESDEQRMTSAPTLIG